MAERPRKGLFLRRLPLEHETAFYLLVSALDVFMTYLLLRQNDGADAMGPRFIESNPIARWFLHRWGMRGMIYFKFSMVAVVCLIAQIVAARRINSARWLLRVATLIVAAVVVYSFVLYLKGPR